MSFIARFRIICEETKQEDLKSEQSLPYFDLAKKYIFT